MGRKKSRDKDEWIKIQEEADGITQLVVPLRLRLDEEEEEQEEKQALYDPADVLSRQKFHGAAP
jgi:hypothetical protein